MSGRVDFVDGADSKSRLEDIIGSHDVVLFSALVGKDKQSECPYCVKVKLLNKTGCPSIGQSVSPLSVS